MLMWSKPKFWMNLWEWLVCDFIGLHNASIVGDSYICERCDRILGVVSPKAPEAPASNV
jgi:hypothetical protein